MTSPIDLLRSEFQAALAAAASPNAVKSVRDEFLSRKQGRVTALLKAVGSAAPDERRTLGAQANLLKQEIEAALDAREAELEATSAPPGAVDVTLPGRRPPAGRPHPLSQVRQRVEDIFLGMGYQIIAGPELEDDWHNFEALNMPAEHPARDMQDTLYLASPVPAPGGRAATLLRTHTSGMQIRHMETHQPPVRIIAPGRVYRRDDIDATHTPMFTQVEGLVVDEGISLGDLKGTLNAFAQRFFDTAIRTRFRPSFFPYTEPSAELDVECQGCNGAGCALCKHTGWIEVLGCGMVHPAVFEAVGYDAERYTGFAFGIGIERLALRLYGIDDIRMFYENDTRFLRQVALWKLSVAWMREFVNVTADPAEIAARLATCGFEVASVEGDVIDFEITANRPDCLSVLGLAREAGTAFDVDLVAPASTADRPGPAAIPVSIGDAGCGRYAVALANVKVGPSPAWLADRLIAAGVRPINNVVDVTNYVMIETGHPMHAFDVAKLAGPEIRVRRARAGEELLTLDGVERKLDETMLVIADRERPIAIAGVMGGMSSEVAPTTTHVAIESAWFLPSSVRATSRRLDLKTEASARFERGADITAPVRALGRALELFEKIGAGSAVGGTSDVYPRVFEPRRVAVAGTRVARLLGDQVPDTDIRRILGRLGFGLTATTDGWLVDVPPFRVDVSREADLIEEIGRHWGFDRIPATFPALRTPAPPLSPLVARDRVIRRVLSGAGLQEACTFTFIERDAATPFVSAPDELVRIANPLSEKFAVLRPSLLPGLVDALVYSRRRETDDVRLFESGAAFLPTGEVSRLAWVLTGARSDHWSGGAGDVDVFDAKGVAELLGEALGLHVTARATESRPWFVRGRAADLFISRGKEGDATAASILVGAVGQLRPELVAARGLSHGRAVVGGEIDLAGSEMEMGQRAARIEPLPKYPSIVRDLSMFVSERLPAADVRGTIRSNAPHTLVSVHEFDRYQGKGVPDGSVSVSMRLTFRDRDRTLTDVDVQRAVDAIVQALVTTHSAVIRGRQET